MNSPHDNSPTHILPAPEGAGYPAHDNSVAPSSAGEQLPGDACGGVSETPRQGGSPLTIRQEPISPITVGAGGPLIVPQETMDSGIEDDTELDLAALATTKVRKPHRREWIALNPASELTTRLLLHRPKADGIEVEHYYVDPSLRGGVAEELKFVRVFLYYSYTREPTGSTSSTSRPRTRGMRASKPC